MVLAPMAGVNDPIFRGICKRMGADLTYTEMVSAAGLAYGSQKTQTLLYISKEEAPAAVQLFGKDPETLAQQARYLEEHYGQGIALIDINMGCPARKIAGKGEGAALMKDPALAALILRAVVGAVSLPVSVKFRKGYGLGDNTAVEFARMAQDCGVCQIAVHGRTAQQFYHGASDRDLISQVKQAVGIPVLASGDVFTTDDIKAYLEEQGADGVMVARGAQGNPWIFSRRIPSLQERVDIAREHAQGLAALFPHRLASMRKHIPWYFKGVSHVSTLRREVQTCQTIGDYEALLDKVVSWS